MDQPSRRRRWHVLWSLNSVLLLGLSVVVAALYLRPTLERAGATAGQGGALWTTSVLVGLVVVFCVMLLRQGQRLSTVRDELVEAKLQEQRLRSHLLEISSLFDAAHQAQMHLELKPVLNAVSQRLLACLDVDAVSVFLTTPDGDSLRCAAAAGMDVEFIRGAEVRMGEGIAGHVAQTNTPVVLGQDNLHDRFPGSSKPRRTIHAGLCVPLTVRDEVIGVLNATRIERQREFGSSEVRLLGVFAGHLGITIQRIRDLEVLGARANALEKVHRAKDAFLCALNHELRTPLATIAAYAEVLLEPAEIGVRDQNEYGRTILSQSHRLRESLEELQDLYALEGSALSLEPAAVRLNGMVEQALEETVMRTPGPELGVRLDPDCDDVTVEVDGARMRKGIRILVGQVRRHLRAGTSLRVITRFHRTCLEGPQALVLIESTGERLGLDGILPDGRAPVDRRTSHTDGLRWTMHLVSQLVEAHGGRAWCEDTSEGARISLTLPGRIVPRETVVPEPVAFASVRVPVPVTVTRYAS